MPRTPHRRPTPGRTVRVQAGGQTEASVGIAARWDAALAQAEQLAGELTDLTCELRSYVTRHDTLTAWHGKDDSAPREDPPA